MHAISLLFTFAATVWLPASPVHCAPTDVLSPAVGSSQPAAAPLRRHIVPDLTAYVQSKLADDGIDMLIVLPAVIANKQGNPVGNNISINWTATAASVKAYFVYNYRDFMLMWHSHIRHDLLQLQKDRIPEVLAPPLPTVQQQQQQLQMQSAPHTLRHRAAVQRHQHMLPQHRADFSIIGAPDDQHRHSLGRISAVSRAAVMVETNALGQISQQQLYLTAAISRQLRHWHALSISYNPADADKGKSVVVWDIEGNPLEAVFESTNKYRHTFATVYMTRQWGTEGGGSGGGSTLNVTATLQRVLPALVAKYNLQSMLDSSCGSMHWMPQVLDTIAQTKPSFRFLGTDVVCAWTNRHNLLLTNNASRNWQFQCLDYANEPLPSGYDLIFSRDSLQHVPFHAAWMFLNNVKASGAKYLLVGSYVKSSEPNMNIGAGQYYTIDLTKPPFNLKQPVEVIDEHTIDGKHMLLFDVRNMTWTDRLLDIV